MTDFAIPKEQQTAYQRWEMSSFVEENSVDANAKAKAKKEEKQAKQAEQQKQDDTLNQVLENIRKEAYTKGMQEGYLVGMAKAKEHMEDERQQMAALAESFQAALENADEEIADDLLSLALDIAKSMLKIKLEVDRAAIIPVVMDAINYSSTVQKPARILVHHEDAHILREYLAEELLSQDWQVLEDSNIERGGCMVETGTNQIDARTSLRWKRITDALASNNDWLLP
jgi:flagellar assembly protein FliH